MNAVKTAKLDVKAVLLTHYHEDHSGGAYLFKETFNIDVFAPKKSLQILAKPPEIPLYRQTVWGQSKPVLAKALKDEIEFDEATIVTYETPGHSFDHVSFLTDSLLFVGDLVTNPNPIITMREEDSLRLIDSLKLVVNLNFETAYGGHGVWDKEGIMETLNNMVELKNRINVLSNSGLNIEQIIEKAFLNTPKRVLLMEETSEGEWSRRNLAESLLGIKRKPPGLLENG